MALVIPDEALQAASMTERELREEIAILLFRQGRLTLSRASRLAGLSRLEFQRLLASRKIPMHYDVEDFRKDISTLQGAGLL